MLERDDAGLEFGLGFSYNKFYFGGQYNFGMLDFIEGNSMKSRTYSISLGYNF